MRWEIIICHLIMKNNQNIYKLLSGGSITLGIVRIISETAKDAAKVGLVFLITNASSFSTVAMEKYLSGYDKNFAAFVNSLSATPGLYDLGFDLGHELFYNDSNFMRTAEKQTGSKNLIPRPYLDYNQE